MSTTATHEPSLREQAEHLAAEKYPESDFSTPVLALPFKESFISGYLAGAKASAAEAEATVPEGLCGDRRDHEPHTLAYAAVVDGPMFCHADQSRRVPNRIPQP